MSKPTPEQIKKQKVEWAKDFMEHAETGKPMRGWEFKDMTGKWYRIGNVRMLDDYECRRERELYTFYWCVVRGMGDTWIECGKTENEVKDSMQNTPIYLQQLTPIKKETVELTEITK